MFKVSQCLKCKLPLPPASIKKKKKKQTDKKHPTTARTGFSKCSPGFQNGRCQLTNVNSRAGCHAGLSEAPSPCRKCPR